MNTASTSLDSVGVELRLEEVDLHGGEQVALPERVRHRVLLAGMDLGYHENVVEEEYLALVDACNIKYRIVLGKVHA